MNRRVACAAVGALLAAAWGGAGLARDETGFEGSWGGARGDLSAQVIVASGKVLGFYWRDDYLQTDDGKLSGDGKVLRFAFVDARGRRGEAALTRTGPQTATLAVSQAGKTEIVELKRD